MSVTHQAPGMQRSEGTAPNRKVPQVRGGWAHRYSQEKEIIAKVLKFSVGLQSERLLISLS